MSAPIVPAGFLRAALAVLGLLASPWLPAGGGMAQAQPAICQQIRAELASLPSGGPRRDTSRLQVELNRVRFALQQNDCNRQGFLIFGQAPPVCGPLRAQAGQLQAQINAAGGGGGGGRRAELLAALDRNNCNAPADQRGVIYAAPRSPSLFDQLFGLRRGPAEPGLFERPPLPDERDPADSEPSEPKERLGGNLAVCVRTCDGFFFPVNFEGMNARQEYEAVCQALCPASETQVYFMRLGAEISSAATRGGDPYMSLPAAMKYRETRVEGCTCKPQSQTWASLAVGMDDIVEARRGDIVVTPDQAIALSRPKGFQPEPEPQAARTSAARKKLEEQKKLAERRKAEEAAALPDPVPLPESALPTGGSASAGIGPKISSETVLGATQGVQQEVVGNDGVRRQVRVVSPARGGPEPPPGPKAAARP